jgi:hypothetical protein
MQQIGRENGVVEVMWKNVEAMQSRMGKREYHQGQ